MIAATPQAVELMHRGTLALSEMEKEGLCIDVPYLKKAIKKTSKQIKQMQEELHDDKVYRLWRKVYGYKTNLGSRSQLARIVFKELGYEEKKERSSSGNIKADKEALEHVDLPFVRKLIDLEVFKKAQNTYLVGLLREVVDGKVHCIYNLNKVVTFRSSSSDPNMQNMPVRDKRIGSLIRRSFVAPKGCRIAELDQGQLEWRGAGTYSLDPVWIAYCTDPTKDVHRDLALQLFCLHPKKDYDPKNEKSKEARYHAKNKFVFAQVYGSYYRDCAKSLWDAIRQSDLQTSTGVPMKKHLKKHGIRSRGACAEGADPVPGTFEYHVKEVEHDLWKVRFQQHYAWRMEWWNKYVERGWFRMKTGFISRGLFDRNQVLNSPVQGACFHIVLWTIIEMQKWLKKNKMKSRVVNQVHDSVMFYLYKGEEEDVLRQANYIMTQSVREYYKWIVVPLVVEAKVAPKGGSWFDITEVPIPE